MPRHSWENQSFGKSVGNNHLYLWCWVTWKAAYCHRSNRTVPNVALLTVAHGSESTRSLTREQTQPADAGARTLRAEAEDAGVPLQPGKRTAVRRGAPPRAAAALSAPPRPVPAPGAKGGLAAASAGECAASGSRTHGSLVEGGPGRKPGEEHRFPIFISRNLREVMGSCDGECQAVSSCCCSYLVGAKTTNLDFYRINYNK